MTLQWTHMKARKTRGEKWERGGEDAKDRRGRAEREKEKGIEKREGGRGKLEERKKRRERERKEGGKEETVE